MNLNFRENYWDSPEAKREYIRFLNDIFSVDLSRWDQCGFWDPSYRPFSYFDGDRLVANVCIYTLEMIVQGQRRRAAQISAVATLPDYRRRGLSASLMNTALQWARDRHEFLFLFADDPAASFYQKFGFRPVDESAARVSVTGAVARPGAVKLDLQRLESRAQVNNLARQREPVSAELGVLNDRLLMFWCLEYLADCLYYIEDLELVIALKRDGGLVTIYDIIGPAVPPFAVVYPYICQPTDKAVEFLFMVDKLGLTNERFTPLAGNGTHVFGDFPLTSARSCFPFTAHA